MSVTLYREGLPRVSITAPHIDSREGMLVGLVDETHVSPSVYGILMLEDGSLTRADFSDFRIQMRYDVQTDQWIDENEAANPAISINEPDQE